MNRLLQGADATHDYAAQFVSFLEPNAVIALSGDLGAGKTTFVQGLLRGLGLSMFAASSPTFTYLHPYPTSPPLFHFDLYRLRSPEDFLAMGFDEYFEAGGITVIEWPERIQSLLPAQTIYISLLHESSEERRLVIA